MARERPVQRRSVHHAQLGLLIGVGAGMALSLALTALLGRTLPGGDFGFFALVSTIFLLTRTAIDLGAGNVVAREVTHAPSEEPHRLEELLGLRLVLAAIAAAGCAVAALAEDRPAHRLVLLAATLVLPLLCGGGLTVVFQLRQAQFAAALMNIGAQVAALTVCGVLLMTGGPGWSFAAVAVGREAVVALGTWGLAAWMLGYVPQPSLNPAALSRLARVASGYGASALLYNLAFQNGLFFVFYLTSGAELGAFAAALRPIAPLVALPGAALAPLVPVLSAATHDDDLFRRQVWGTLNLSIGVGAVVAAAGVVLAPAVVELLYGGRFLTGPLSAVPAFRWMAVALGCAFVIEAVAIVLLSERRERELLGIAASMLGLSIAVTLLTVPRLGFVGAAGAMAVAGVAGALMGLAVVRRAGAQGRITGSLAFLLPAAALGISIQMAPGPALVQVLAGVVLSLAALLVLWRMPGIAAYRAEQARLVVQGAVES